MPGDSLRAEPLTMKLLAHAPLRWRMISWIYNRKCKAVFERVLSLRNATIVNGSWKGSAVEERLRESVSALIAKHLYWSKPMFMPQDECFVLFGGWQRGIADCMERENFITELESLLNLDIPDNLRLSSMTYVEFLGALETLGKRRANRHDKSPMP